MATVFLNGRFVGIDEARVSAFDAGFQHGVGLFETMSARLGTDGKAEVFRLEQHLDRLINSAKALGLTDLLRVHALAEAVAGTVEQSKLARARVRLTITGGDLNLLTQRQQAAAPAEQGQPPRKGIDPTVMIVAQPATQYPPEMFERGVSVIIGETRLNPLDPMAGHKTLNYWGRLRELQEAAAKQAGEAILLLVTNHLGGGCVSNVFLFKEGRLSTPIARGEEAEVAGLDAAKAAGEAEQGGTGGGSPRLSTGGVLPSPVLPGVTRGWIMDWAREQQVPVVRRMLSIDDLLTADEVFLTNSSWGVLPVVRVEREEIGDGEVGGLTADVRRAWLMESDAIAD
jgi:branched-chain amino acid aminotransferase